MVVYDGICRTPLYLCHCTVPATHGGGGAVGWEDVHFLSHGLIDLCVCNTGNTGDVHKEWSEEEHVCACSSMAMTLSVGKGETHVMICIIGKIYHNKYSLNIAISKSRITPIHNLVQPHPLEGWTSLIRNVITWCFDGGGEERYVTCPWWL